MANKADTLELKLNNLQERIDSMSTALMVKTEYIQEDNIRLSETIHSMSDDLTNKFKG